MSPSFAVDLDLLQSLADRMTSFERRVESVQGELDARVRRVHAVWQGSAATAHLEAHERWLVGAREMHEAVAVLRSIATTARANYLSAIQTNRTMWVM